MRELLRANDPVLISFVESLLRGQGIEHAVLDENMSVLEGSLGILPRRVLVATEDWAAAARLLREADLGQWISSTGAPA
jgi:hypothetical protein